MLEVRGLTKTFDGLAAVSDVTFDVRAGEILGLIGPNGSGKSTIFNLIAGALAPTAGEVRFENRLISRLAPNAVRRLGVARTFQIPRPIRGLSIHENIEIAAYYGVATRPSAREVARAVGEALALVDLEATADTRVDGLGASGLKKLELARALATNPKLLLADESLGGLAWEEMERAADMLRRIRDERGVTIVWVEHIMGVLMRVVERVVVLDHGEVIFDGPPVAARRDARVAAVYLGADHAGN